MKEFNLTSFGLGLLCAAAIFTAVGWRTTQSGVNSMTAAVAVHCNAQGETVYAADLNGVHVSRDFGKTWITRKPGSN